MNLHLFSSSEPDLGNVVRLSQKYLHHLSRPLVLYIPPQVKQEYVLLTRQVLQNLADVQVIDLQFVEQHQFERCLQVASMIFVPGGNTYILNFRLHQNGLMESLRRVVLQKHVPYVGISAGTLVSGANILTSNDLNACGCTVFTGLQLVPYNFCAHFPPEDSPDRQGKEDRIMAYHEFHQNPVLALEDGAHIWVNDGTARLDSGNAWFYEKGRDPVRVLTGVAL